MSQTYFLQHENAGFKCSFGSCITLKDIYCDNEWQFIILQKTLKIAFSVEFGETTFSKFVVLRFFNLFSTLFDLFIVIS